METKSNKGFVVLLSIIMVVLVLGVVFLIYQNNQLRKEITTKENTSKSTELKSNTENVSVELDNDDNLVKLLANQVESNLSSNNGYYNETGYLFKNKKITTNDLSALEKFAIAFKVVNPARIWVSDCSSFSNAKKLNNTSKIFEACNNITDNGLGKATTYLQSKISNGVAEEVYDLNYDELKNNYESIFNQKLSNSVSFNECGYMCKYDQETNNMFCSYGSCGGTSSVKAYALVDHAVKYNDYVELFDYYALIDYSNQGIYLTTNSDGTTQNIAKVGTYTGAENTKVPDDVMKKYGQLYKHTFKLNNNGSYYWYSSEPVNK